MSEEMVCRKRRLSSFQIIILGFAGVILLGALLLMLPLSTTAGCVTPFHEALFTATSAVCVTGLVVQDTGSYWSTFGQADSRVRTFLYLAGNEGLQASEALSFLKSLDSSKARLPRIDPNGLSLKMLKICSLLIEAGTLRPFSICWPKSAIISNTDCLIHASTAFRKTGNASTLSLIDILEPKVDEKYFLSPQATARLLYN